MTTIQKFRGQTYQCAVFACSWGCCAWLEADLFDAAKEAKRAELIGGEDNILVVYEPSRAGLNLAEQDYFKRGFLWARRQLEREKFLYVYVRSVVYNECDFQPEILFFLSAGWLLQTVNHKELKFDWSYDKSANRYNFIFPDE